VKPGKGGDGVIVDGYSERWLRRRFPWVYPKEVVRGRGRAGAEVLVRSGAGEVLGRGIGDDGWLAVRVYRHDGGPLDDAWLFGVLDRAKALRDVVVDGSTDAHRLVNAENDGLPGIRVDRWGDRLVLILDSPAVAGLVDGIARWAADRLAPAGIHLCYRPDPRDTIDIAAADPRPGLVAGAPTAGPVTVRERGLAFRVRPDEGPDVGLYPDMREVRAWLEPRWRGRRVLNLFAYTGAFSVSAAVNGAASVTTVDLSEKYLGRAKDNFAANGLPVDPEKFLAEDTFKALDRFRRKGETFDAIVSDPPSFSHGPSGLWSAAKDTPRLVAACARVLAPDGWLIAASNLGEMSPHAFRGEVDEGIRKAERAGQELWFGGQGPDYPAATWFPEGRYLKVGVWRLL
jgi:23S rRNA (cytosine1962-C5)-methyltransferase